MEDMRRRPPRNAVETPRDLSDTALKCHTFGHRWDAGPVIADSYNGVTCYSVRLRCDCDKERTDMLDRRSFDLIGRHYTKPVGYNVTRPSTRAEFRAEVQRRADEIRKHNRRVKGQSRMADRRKTGT